MANSEGVSGVHSFVLFGEETAYNTEQATVATHLGIIQKFSPRVSNNNTYSRGFKGTTTGGRNVAKIVPGKVEHSFDIDMQVYLWDFLKYVLGTVGGGPVYSEADSPPSITLHRCIDNPGSAATDRDEIWTGCVIDTCTIKASVGEPVTVSLGFKAAGRKFDTTILSAVALPSVDLYDFAGGSIELPNATPLTNIIDSFEISITNNFDMLYGLGSRLAQNARAKSRDYKIKFSVKYLDNTLIQNVLGSATPSSTTDPTENATIELNFSNGTKSCAFLFSTFVFDDHSGKEDVAEIIGEDLTGTAVSLTVTEDQT